MEINLKQLSTQAIESTTGTKKMRLSENAQSMVFQLFTKNVYSNPIGTVVREITSNCFDSHVEAKVNSPVLIKKWTDKQTDTIYISFIDYGVGMSPDRVENIYGVYFESTKRVDNTQIGGFGIGGKTPLAYKRSTGQGEGEYDNSFYVITNFDGVKYYYCIYEGLDTPVISLLHQESTTERNGTEVRIPILAKDVETFTKEMVRQLYYFENVIFEGFTDVWRYSENLTNNYQIVRGKTFLYRGTEYDSKIHICLGRVAYPVDYNALGLSASNYNLPVAIKLEVGEIGVTVSRESLDYSESTIKILKQKLTEVVAEIKELIGKQYANIATLEDYFNVTRDFGTLKFNDKLSMYVGNLIKQADVDFSNFKYSFMKMPNDKQLFRFFFSTKAYGKKPSRSRYNSSNYEFEGGYKELQSSKNVLYINDDFDRKVVKQAYLKSEHDLFYIISKRSMMNNDNDFMSDIADLFRMTLTSVYKQSDDGLSTIIHPFIQDLIRMQDEYFTIVQKSTVDYDALIVPDDFIQNRKRGSGLSKEILKTTIPVKFHANHHSKNRVTLDMLFKYKNHIFYGGTEDEQMLINYSQLFKDLFDVQLVEYVSGSKFVRTCDSYYGRKKANINDKNSMMFIQVANNNLKYMKYCTNAHHISEFFWKILYRKEEMVKNYFQTSGLLEKYNNLNSLYRDENFKRIDVKWGIKINRINRLINTIPNAVRNSNLDNHKRILNIYFKLDDIKLTKEQEKISTMLDELVKFEEVNKPIFYWVNRPYNLNDTHQAHIDILKSVMILS